MRDARIGAVRTLPLAAAGNAGEDGGDRLAERGRVGQEQALQVAADGAQSVTEVRLLGLLARLGAEAGLGLVGEQAGHRDQAEMGAELLADQALALAVEALDLQVLFADLVQFFHAPARMVEVREGADGVAAAVEQGGGQQVVGVAGGVADQADAAGPPAGRGLLLAGRVGGRDGDDAVAAAGAAELLADRVGVGLEAEDGVQAAVAVGVQQAEAVVAAVVDDDIGGGEGGQVGQGQAALVAVGGEFEVDRQAGAQTEQAAEQALGVVRAVGGAGGSRSRAGVAAG